MNRKRYLFSVTDVYGETWTEYASGIDVEDARERLIDRIDLASDSYGPTIVKTCVLVR